RRLLLAALTCAPFSMAFGQAAVARQRSSDASAEVRALEDRMWEHWKNRQFDSMKALIAADAVIVGGDGASTREQAIEDMKKSNCDVKSVSLRDVHVTFASPTVAVITYRSKSDGTCDGKALSQTGRVNSSVWSRRDGHWQTA